MIGVLRRHEEEEKKKKTKKTSKTKTKMLIWMYILDVFLRRQFAALFMIYNHEGY